MNPVSAIPDDSVLTPHGLVHKTCVHLIGEDSEAIVKCQHRGRDILVRRQMSSGGWIESATFTPSEPLGSMKVTFTVPEPPSKTGALIYLFPGAEDAQLTTILQPVLQWGSNGLFGGEFWTIASWNCSPDRGTWVSKRRFEVFTGETIVGTVKKTKILEDSCDWVVETAVAGDPERSAMLSVPNLKPLLLYLIGGALEAYLLATAQPLQPGPADCSLFPASGSTAFTDIELHDLNENSLKAAWVVRYPAGTCGFNVEVSYDLKTVTLMYC
jgi:hypothetical protein